MEGPTPVSALIHAATMVAAGVYLIARTFPLFAASATALPVVMVIGTITAFFAATIACVMTDIKRVLAYSTISQLGFMVAALGVGSSTASIFHLTTHAWFKALLFLGAGSVIHATHTQDVREMGGLATSMPWTCLTMGIAVWAISGIPPLSGFWSKDEILVAAWDGGHPLVTGVLIATSALTAFYMMRLFALAFWGEARGHGHGSTALTTGPHESPAVMTAPLVLLSVGAAGIGLLGSPWAHHWFQSWLTAPGAHVAPSMHLALAGLTSGLALAAVIFAARRYTSLRARAPQAVWKVCQPLHALLAHAYYVDELYGAVILAPLRRLWELLAQFDQRVIDRAVDLSGMGSVAVSRWKERFDHYVVDGAVNGVAAVTTWCGCQGRKLQTGNVQHYLLAVVLGAVSLVWWAIRANVR